MQRTDGFRGISFRQITLGDEMELTYGGGLYIGFYLQLHQRSSNKGEAKQQSVR
jgi:hypothetical protein